MDQVRRKTNATSAYQRHLTGKGVTVAFLDTGISMHPAYWPLESCPLPQQIPATCVPCPLSSYGYFFPF